VPEVKFILETMYTTFRIWCQYFLILYAVLSLCCFICFDQRYYKLCLCV